jgi:hypothetical protein
MVNNRHGSIMVELMAALAILVAGILPLTYVYVRERQLAKAQYQRAIAMAIVDGEMELLRAGEWRAQPEGTHDYPVTAAAARNLPPGRLQLTRTGPQLRLVWQPTQPAHGGVVTREAHGR